MSVFLNQNLKICLAVDNNLKMSLRQRFGKHYFRFFVNPIADFYFAAGKSTHNLLTYFGVSPNKIFLGYYGYQSDIFYQRETLKRFGFVFVGQKIKRKGIDILVSDITGTAPISNPSLGGVPGGLIRGTL